MVRIITTIKLGLLCGTVLGLSSCIKITISDEKTSSIPGSLARTGTPYVIAQYRQPENAFVEMPMEAGEIIAVTQKNYKNGVSQRIVFRSGNRVDGENHIIVRATKDRNYSKNTTTTLEVHTNEYRELVRDFKKEFPGRPFSLNNRPERNSYGVFGHVFFADGGATNCVYAWQNAKSKALNTTWIERVRERDVELSLRYRFCGNNMKESSAIAAITRVSIVLNPDDLKNNQEYLWRMKKEDDIGYLSSDDPESEFYKSSAVETGVQYLDEPDKIRAKRKKKKSDKTVKATPVKAKRTDVPKKSTIFVPPPQDEFGKDVSKDAEMRQRVENLDLLSPPSNSKRVPAPKNLPRILPKKLPKISDAPMVQLETERGEVIRSAGKNVRVVRAAAPKIKDRIAIPLPEDQ